MPQWLSSCRPGSAYPSAQRGGSLCSQAFYHLGHSKETQRRRHLPSRNSCWRRLCRPFFYEWIWSHQQHTSRQTRLCTVDEQWSHRCLATNINQPLWRGEDITLPTSTNQQLSLGRNQSTPFSTTCSYIRGRLQQPLSRLGIRHSQQRQWHATRRGIMPLLLCMTQSREAPSGQPTGNAISHQTSVGCHPLEATLSQLDVKCEPTSHVANIDQAWCT